MSKELQKYNSYYPVEYDYVDQLPTGWLLLPNIAIFEERIERGHISEELLSVTIGKGVIKQADVEIKKDSSNEDKSNYKLVKEGDIAYNKMRMWQGALGYSQYQGIVSPAYVVLKPKLKVNPKFFHYMFRASFYINYSKRFSYGIVDDQLSLRYTDFKRMYSIIPPREVQSAIVAFLDAKSEQINLAISRKKRLIELLEEQRQALIVRIMTEGVFAHQCFKESGIKWLGHIPTQWQVRRFFWEVVIQEGPGIMAVDFRNDGIPLLRISGMKGKYASLNGCNYLQPEKVKKRWNHFRLNRGDILISCSASTDIVCEVGEEVEGAIPYTGIIRLKPRKATRLNKNFLKYFIASKIYQEQVALLKAGSTIQHYGPTHLKGFFLLLPTVEEQLEMVAVIEKEIAPLDKAISKAQSEILTIEEYRDSLITELILGRRAVPS
jgi:type I restriction enzyme, S subunit